MFDSDPPKPNPILIGYSDCPPTPNTMMMIKLKFLTIFITLCSLLFSLSLANSNHESSSSNPHVLPRPLILEYPAGHVGIVERESEEELHQLQCTSWRFAVETNNCNPWKTIPEDCADYVKNYLTGRAYKMDLDRVNNEASAFARSVHHVGDDGKDVWVFDVDETLISNLPYYDDHGYGLEVFDHLEFDKWVEKGMAPAIESSLRLYEELLALGIKVFLLTGRSEAHREITVQNLMNVGFKNWDRLILRGPDDKAKLATDYKSEKRDEIVKEGFRILGNSGDQWSDLLGSSMPTRSFKLPNPMYYIL